MPRSERPVSPLRNPPLLAIVISKVFSDCQSILRVFRLRGFGAQTKEVALPGFKEYTSRFSLFRIQVK